MKKELYLYSNIYSFTAEYFISQLEENKGNDIVIRMNTNGGDPQAAFGMIAKMKEHPKNVHIKVDAKAYSSGAYMLPYANKVTALNVSKLIIHRAAWPENYEANYMTAEEKEDLIAINKDLRAALEKKVDPTKFALLTGVTFDEIFDLSQRKDVRLNAEMAKTIGLVDEIVDINSDLQLAAFSDSKMLLIEDETVAPAAEATPTDKNLPTNKKPIMTILELQAAHPAAFAAAVAQGAEAERERIGAWMAFADVDIEAVKKGITEGKNLMPTMMAELSRKAISKEALKEISTEAAGAVVTPEAEVKAKTEETKNIEAFLADVNKDLNVKK